MSLPGGFVPTSFNGFSQKYHWLQFLLSKAFCIYELLGETLKRNKFIFFNERYRHEISPVDYLL